MEEIKLHYASDLCIGCGACENHIAELLSFEDNGIIYIDLKHGAILNGVMRAIFSCKSSALWLE